MHRILLSLPLFFALSVHAQDAGTGAVVLTGSGRTAFAILQALSVRAGDGEAPQSFAELSLPEKQTAAWDAQEAKFRARLADLRRECREAMRRANRDTLPQTANRCIRSELLLEIHMLRQRQEEFSRTPALSPLVATDAAQSVTALLSAQATMVDAIDAGVFSTVDLLKEAKRNLHVQYRVPVRRALLRVRADRVQSWCTLTATVLLPLLAEDDADALALAQSLEAVSTHAAAALGDEESDARIALAEAWLEIDNYDLLLNKYIKAQQKK